MLSQAVEQGIISQAEADNFDSVHTKMDTFLNTQGVSGLDTSPRADALPQIMVAMVSAAEINQSQADSFMAVHDRLVEAGLMQ